MTSSPANSRDQQTQGTSGAGKRVGVSEALSVWKEAHAQTGKDFLQKRNVGLLWQRLTEATDQLMVSLAGVRETKFAIAAVGGYGRGQLFPYSDIDLLIIVPEGEVPTPSIERVLYGLWDMPLKLGQAVRTVADTVRIAREDHTVMTALLDLRHVAGNPVLTQKMQKAVNKELIGSQVLPFVEAKLKERDQRHARALDSRFVLEPNVKEGKGGLRDLHTIWWLARYCYDVERIEDLAKGIFTGDDAKAYREAEEFLSTVRASLHLMGGRAEERLTFDAQLKLAQTYHYRQSGEESAKRFMRHYFHHATKVGELTRSFCTLLEDEKKRKPTSRLAEFFAPTKKLAGFVLEGERLSVTGEKQLRDDPILILELFAVSQAQGIDIHPNALRHVANVLPMVSKKDRNSERANWLLKAILLSPKEPDVTLRRMNEAGVLARFLPEFKHIAGQMQYDRYHTYTVDEHTLVAVANLHKLEKGEWRELMPIATDIIGQIHSREALYMAMLLHDIGKGYGNQTERGAVLSRDIAKRMGCSPADVETIAWLVASHLLMSEVAFKRDLDDPKTIADFAAVVQTPERLRLLLLITVADICAVGPKVWNGWKGALLRDLYKRAMAVIAGEERTTEVSQVHKQALAEVLKEEYPQWGGVDAFVAEVATPAFWQRSSDEQVMLATLYHDFHAHGDIAAHVVRNAFHAVTEVTLCMHNTPHLLHRVAGAAALMGASIVSAKLMVAGDETSWVTVGLQDVTGVAFDEGKAVETLPAIYREVEAGKRDLSAEIVRARPRYFAKKGKVELAYVHTDNALSATYSVVEVSGGDRIGFLHDVAEALSRAGVVIATAHIATYGARAVDVFYVKDVYGHKLLHPAKQDAVERAVLEAISG